MAVDVLRKQGILGYKMEKLETFRDICKGHRSRGLNRDF